jgi:hypothetical protein
MADAINAKSDVLGERELDAMSGGSISIAGLVGLWISSSKSPVEGIPTPDTALPECGRM